MWNPYWRRILFSPCSFLNAALVAGGVKKGVDTFLRLFLFRFLMCWNSWVSVALVSSSRLSQPGGKGLRTDSHWWKGGQTGETLWIFWLHMIFSFQPFPCSSICFLAFNQWEERCNGSHRNIIKEKQGKKVCKTTGFLAEHKKLMF